MSASDPTQSDGETRDSYPSFDGDTYGESYAIDKHGNFIHDPDGSIFIVDGPTMVNRQLIRTLRTPKGDDPLRPEFGLDLQKLLNGRNDLLTKEAIIEAIGPNADPRVASLDPDDITIYKPGGSRENAQVEVHGTLADGSAIGFALEFEAMVKSAAPESISEASMRFETDDRRPLDTSEGWGRNWGVEWGQ